MGKEVPTDAKLQLWGEVVTAVGRSGKVGAKSVGAKSQLRGEVGSEDTAAGRSHRDVD